jgi:hypothetical protein
MVRASGERTRSRRGAGTWRGIGLAQETSVQNSHPSNLSPVSTEPSIAADALARAYERARARILGGEPRAGDLFAAFTGFDDEHPDEKTRPHGPAAPHAAAPRDSGARRRGARPDGGDPVTLDELLPVLRDPIHWALSRAERCAQGDPVDLAAIDRVRGAYQSRLAATGTGGALGDARAKVRPTDLLTVAGLVVRSIDPSFAQRASTGARASLLDALAAAIPLGLAHAPGGIDARHPAAALLCYLDEIADEPAPFAPLRIPHAAALGCCCGGHHHIR